MESQPEATTVDHAIAEQLAELNRIRLERDLTYEQLADEIGDIDPSALHRLLNQPGRRPIDRTLFKIRRYLERRRVVRGSRREATRG